MFSHFINNTLLDGAGAAFESFDPGAGKPLATYHAGTAAEVDQAVRAAREAFDDWSLLSVEMRIGYLNAFGELLKKEKNSAAPNALPLLISQEMGKPFWESLT